jgi:hypothetical protein
MSPSGSDPPPPGAPNFFRRGSGDGGSAPCGFSAEVCWWGGSFSEVHAGWRANTNCCVVSSGSFADGGASSAECRLQAPTRRRPAHRTFSGGEVVTAGRSLAASPPRLADGEDRFLGGARRLASQHELLCRLFGILLLTVEHPRRNVALRLRPAAARSTELFSVAR